MYREKGPCNLIKSNLVSFYREESNAKGEFWSHILLVYRALSFVFLSPFPSSSKEFTAKANRKGVKYSTLAI